MSLRDPAISHRRIRTSLLFLACLASPLAAQEKVDLAAIDKIKDEGFQRSQVMEVASWLTDVYGARLTNSPNYKNAGEWAAKKLTEWGLVGAKLEPWGPSGVAGRTITSARK